MIRYPLTNRDAMRTIMNQVPAALVRFTDPQVQEFFEDERLGLCTIQVRRLTPIEIIDANLAGTDVQHHILVQYNDADLHMIKLLSV